MKSLALFLLLFNISSVLKAAPTAHWIIANDTKGELVADGNVLQNDPTGDWEKNNAIWSEGLSSAGARFWQFNLTEFSNGSVGLTTKGAFSAGWDLKGLFYEANLVDGEDLLLPDFGPQLSSGDIIGILAEFEAGRVKVSFYYNDDDYLGVGFDIAADQIESLHPTLSFEGKGSVALSWQDEEAIKTNNILHTKPVPVKELQVPLILERMGSDTVATERAIGGSWILHPESFQCDETPPTIPEDFSTGQADSDQSVILRISSSSSSNDRREFEVILSVVNTIKFALVYQKQAKIWETPGPRFATNNVGGRDDWIAFERWLISFTDAPTQVVSVPVQGRSVLLWENDECFGLFTRLEASPIMYSPFAAAADEDEL